MGANDVIVIQVQPGSFHLLGGVGGGNRVLQENAVNAGEGIPGIVGQKIGPGSGHRGAASEGVFKERAANGRHTSPRRAQAGSVAGCGIRTDYAVRQVEDVGAPGPGVPGQDAAAPKTIIGIVASGDGQIGQGKGAAAE